VGLTVNELTIVTHLK